MPNYKTSNIIYDVYKGMLNAKRDHPEQGCNEVFVGNIPNASNMHKNMGWSTARTGKRAFNKRRELIKWKKPVFVKDTEVIGAMETVKKKMNDQRSADDEKKNG